MTRRIRSFRTFALAGFCSALSPVLFAAQKSQPVVTNPLADAAPLPVATIPSTVDAPAVADHLIEAFRDASALTRVDLLEQVDASPAVSPEAAVSLLQEALRDEDLLVREAALRALLRRDTTQSPVLDEADVAAFQGENGDLAKVHFAAKHADTNTLKELMQNGNAVVQESAFEALATTDLPGAVEVLHAELGDAKSPHRLQTLELLTRSSYTNSRNQLIPILRDAAQDADPLVRDYANTILKEGK